MPEDIPPDITGPDGLPEQLPDETAKKTYNNLSDAMKNLTREMQNLGDGEAATSIIDNILKPAQIEYMKNILDAFFGSKGSVYTDMSEDGTKGTKVNWDEGWGSPEDQAKAFNDAVDATPFGDSPEDYVKKLRENYEKTVGKGKKIISWEDTKGNTSDFIDAMNSLAKNNGTHLVDNFTKFAKEEVGLKELVGKYKDNRPYIKKLWDHWWHNTDDGTLEKLIREDESAGKAVDAISDASKAKDNAEGKSTEKGWPKWLKWLLITLLAGGIVGAITIGNWVQEANNQSGCYQINKDSSKTVSIKVCDKNPGFNYYQHFPCGESTCKRTLTSPSCPGFGPPCPPFPVTADALTMCRCSDVGSPIRGSANYKAQTTACVAASPDSISLTSPNSPGTVYIPACITPITSCSATDNAVRWENGALKSCDTSGSTKGVEYSFKYVTWQQVAGKDLNNALKCAKDPANWAQCMLGLNFKLPPWVMPVIIGVVILIVLGIIGWIAKKLNGMSKSPNAGQDDIEMVPMRRVKKGT